MLDLLESISPHACPTFTVCWMQLSMHKNVFPAFFKSAEPRLVQFCVNFVSVCIRLSIDFPELFYRGVCRLLITIGGTTPLFFASYYTLLIEQLPERFVQFRNLILRVHPQRPDDVAPPIGFNMVELMRQSVIKSLIDPFLGATEPAVAPPSQSAAQFIASTFKRTIVDGADQMPRLIWQFVVYCFSQVTKHLPNIRRYSLDAFKQIPIVDLFVAIAGFFGDESVRYLFVAIIDQVRFPNPHTYFASSLILALFEATRDPMRELLIVAIMKRLMCVTQPPRALTTVFQELVNQFGNVMKRMLAGRREFDLFRSAKEVIEILGASTVE
jgi:CCR4-NOT transcription complex subunit 1